MFFLLLFILELLLLFFLSRSLTQSLSQLFFFITKSRKAVVNLLSFIFLPGVIIHELSHLIMASILFVPTGEIEFTPQLRDGKAIKMGSVAIGKADPFRRALIGVAPILAGVSIIAGALFYFTSSTSFSVIILLYVLFQITNTMFSSSKDVEGTVELLLVIIILLIALYFIGFRVPQAFINTLFSQNNVDVLKRLNLLFLVPLGLDAVIIAITRMLIKTQN